MMTKLVKWASNDGQITKPKLSDGRRTKFPPSAPGFDYDWLRFKRYLGYVGSIHNRRLLAVANDDWIPEDVFQTNPSDWLDQHLHAPLEPAVTRLVGALMLEQNDEWAVTRRYMTLETVQQVCEDNTMDVAEIASI